VTQQQFYDIALAQLEELWSMEPGELFEVWFDGGLPTDPYFQVRGAWLEARGVWQGPARMRIPGAPVQTGITALLAKYQPSAATYNGYPIVNATSVRWVGTEAGSAPDPTWSSGSCGM
jgi:hypothetical protein